MISPILNLGGAILRHMTNYRRNRIPGGTYFFTLNLADRGAALLTYRIDVLRDAFAQTCAERWFKVDAMVVLPDHLHAVWTLPEDDSDFSTRLRLIKAHFSRGVGRNCPKRRIAAQEGRARYLAAPILGTYHTGCNGLPSSCGLLLGKSGETRFGETSRGMAFFVDPS